jgi:dolichol-phosphate mannosyltransferase
MRAGRASTSASPRLYDVLAPWRHPRTVNQPLVSIVIPTRHEAATIGSFLHRVRAALSGLNLELIVVDDSDRDNTVAVLVEAQRALGNEQMVMLHRPSGSIAHRTLGTAVVTGIRRARGTYVCVMDADGQHPPEVIPSMLAKARQTDADYVGASRYMPGGNPEGLEGVSRKAISLGLALFTRAAFALTPIRRVTDPLSGFFLFRRSLVDGVELKPIGWKISLEVLVRSHAQRLSEVPYTFARRADGDSKASLRQGLLVLRHILVLLLGMAGLQRFALFGLVGLSGMLVNTGTLLALQAAGFEALGWPLWAASEAAILWNYGLNRHVTWRDRSYGTWWLYNLAALGASGIAIGTTTLLVTSVHSVLWLASVAGIMAGMCLNYLMLDKVVFASLSVLAVHPALKFGKRRAPDRGTS